jgi:hypothetical protein
LNGGALAAVFCVFRQGKVKIMSDLYCKQPRCREPWDSYGVRQFLDMSEEEARRFLAGEGCPSCDFGKNPPHDVALPEGIFGSDEDTWDEDQANS